MMPSAPPSSTRDTSATPGTRTKGRDAGFERGHADLAGGIEREARMLHIDIEAVETRGLGDARDLDAADEPHRHRGHNLAAGELVLDVITQNVVDLAAASDRLASTVFLKGGVLKSFLEPVVGWLLD